MKDQELVQILSNPSGARYYLNYIQNIASQTQVFLSRELGSDVVFSIDTIVLSAVLSNDGILVPQISFSGIYKQVEQGGDIAICVLMNTAEIIVGGEKVMTLAELRLLASLGEGLS